MNKKIIVCDGDSWTSGDILDPKLEEVGETFINHIDNDEYRLPKVWPHKLGELTDIEVKNIAVAGSSNDSIVRRIIPQTLKLLETHKPEDIFVIIGWSSPERKDFFLDAHRSYISPRWETLYPAELKQEQVNDDIQKFYNTYLKYFWNIEDFANRYLQQVLLIHNFLKSKGISHKFFNAFYESYGRDWGGDLHKKYFDAKQRGLPDVGTPELQEEIEDLYGVVDNLLFEEYMNIYNENYIKVSFKSHCDSITKTWGKKWDNNHPNEKMHKHWSEYLYGEIFK